jgi:hypothetical protein
LGRGVRRKLADSDGGGGDGGLEARRKHREDLLTQMAERQAAKKAARDKFLREGKGYTGHTDAERKRLERIKAEKLAELERANVPEKYRAELRRKQVLSKKIEGMV